MNSREMQRSNRLKVLRTLLEDGGMLRTELAEKTGLRKATITNIINEFLDLGIVGTVGEPASGRRGEQICVTAAGCIILIVGVSRRGYKVSAFGLGGAQTDLEEGVITPQMSADEFRDRIVSAVCAAADQIGRDHILDICIGVPGPYLVDEAAQSEVFLVSRFAQINEVNLRREVEQAVGMPVSAVHDSKLCGYAEWRSLDADTRKTVPGLAAMTSIGYGAGVGIVIDGSVIMGHLGLAGEIGRTGINFNARRTVDGYRGTYEFFAGTDAAIRYVCERLYEFPDSTLTQDSSYDEIVEAYKNGDQLAVYAMEKVAWMLGYGAANLFHTIAPTYIILENDYPDYQPFLEAVRRSAEQMMDPYIFERVRIEHSGLEDPVMLGGYYYVTEQLLRNGTLLDRIRQIREKEM